MKILSGVLIASSVLCSVALAESAFMGVETGYGFTSKLSSDYGDVKDHGIPTLGIKGGYDYDAFRIYGAYNYDFKAKVNEDEDKVEWTKHAITLGADWTPEINENFKFLLGAYGGLGILDFNGEVTYDDYYVKVDETSVGFLLGARVGGLAEIDEHNEVEFGFKTEWSTYKDFEYIDDIDNTVYEIYAGYNYKF